MFFNLWALKWLVIFFIFHLNQKWTQARHFWTKDQFTSEKCKITSFLLLLRVESCCDSGLSSIIMKRMRTPYRHSDLVQERLISWIHYIPCNLCRKHRGSCVKYSRQTCLLDPILCREDREVLVLTLTTCEWGYYTDQYTSYIMYHIYQISYHK